VEEVFRGDARQEGEAGNLAKGVDAGVCAAGALGEGGLAGNPAESGLELSLDGGFTGLNLPAAEVGAVVGQGEFPDARTGVGMEEIGHGNLSR
jgi:hypothetical protein